MPRNAAQQSDAVIVKKYPNRRLYNTETSSYITLDDLCQMVRDGEEFVVQDAKSGEDLTRQILTQIIYEQETKGAGALPTDFLRNIIRVYDDAMRAPLQQFLDGSMQYFLQNQDKMTSAFNKMSRSGTSSSNAGNTSESFTAPMKEFEKMARQNVDMFQQAFSMFNPFMAPGGGSKKDKR